MRFGHTSICRENVVSDFDLYESEIEELYQKPEEPKVELTIEEARELYWLIEGKQADYAKTEFGWSGLETSLKLHRTFVQKEGSLHLKWCELLPSRIEKAEGKCSSE